jgi:hypothetical protein
MVRRDVVVVAASAGGIEALRQLVGGLPADLAAAIAVVVHMGPAGGDALATILDRSGPIPAHVAVNGEPLRDGVIYVCRGDHHLLLADGRPHLHVRSGPRDKGHRPSADSLFRSAAEEFGERVIGIVLSGMLRDGADGLAAIRSRGGVAIVQDPADAIHPAMPRAALAQAGADHVVAARQMGPLIADLVRAGLGGGDRGALVPPAAGPGGAGAGRDAAARPAAVQASMWVALHALEERIAAQDRLLERTESTGMVITGAQLRDDLGEMSRSAATLREFLECPVPGDHLDVAQDDG